MELLLPLNNIRPAWPPSLNEFVFDSGSQLAPYPIRIEDNTIKMGFW